MQNQLKLSYLIALSLICVVVSCHSDRPTPLDPGAFVGSYVYVSVDTSVDKATDHQFDHLMLLSNGVYDLVQGGATKVRSEKHGEWKLVAGDPPNIELDHSGFPIQMKGKEIRLLINDDLGEWYAKAK